MMQTPVADGLFEVIEGRPKLIGSHCVSCGALYFPQALTCRNPHCRAKQIERALLPDRGTLYSYTVQRYRPPPLFRVDDWAPYALGLVDLGDGLHVMGILTEIELGAIEIGMAVKLVVEPLFKDAERGEVFTYKFAPDGAREAE